MRLKSLIKIVPTKHEECNHNRLCFNCGAFEFVIGVMVGLMGAMMIAQTLYPL